MGFFAGGKATSRFYHSSKFHRTIAQVYSANHGRKTSLVPWEETPIDGFSDLRDKLAISAFFKKFIRKGGIYRFSIINKPNVFYIGSTGIFYTRFLKHTKPNAYEYNGDCFHYVGQTCGWDKFNFEILEVIEDLKTLRDRENFYLRKYYPLLNSKYKSGIVINRKVKHTTAGPTTPATSYEGRPKVIPTEGSRPNERYGGLLKFNRGYSSGFAAQAPEKAQLRPKLEVKKAHSYDFPAFYPNMRDYKDIILKDNAGKAAIYMITNKVTKLKYIGKSSNLHGRFANYFSNGSLERNKGSSLIYRNLLRFGLENFSLTILEYCSIDDLLSRKLHFINIFKPRLNIRKDVLNTGGAHNSRISEKTSISDGEPCHIPLGIRKEEEEASKSNLKSQDEIIHDFHRLNPDLEEFKKNIVLPLKVKEMMDLAESTENPLGWKYHVDKESNGHFAIWFLNNKTDQAFYGYTAYWKDGEISNNVGFYELKAPRPIDI